MVEKYVIVVQKIIYVIENAKLQTFTCDQRVGSNSYILDEKLLFLVDIPVDFSVSNVCSCRLTPLDRCCILHYNACNPYLD